LEHFAPEVWACLGTRTPTLDPKPFYQGRKQVFAALRRRWPEVELVNLREFTTGYGPRSGGLRRPHWNLLLKGVPSAAVGEAAEVVGRVWCQHVDAEPERQHVGAVYEAGGLGRYLALHFQKQEQAPPKGWKGHRFTSSRGYFPEGVKAARGRAKESLGLRREVWKLEVEFAESIGVIPAGLDLWGMAEARVLERSAVDWSLAHVLQESPDPVRARHLAAREPFRHSTGKRSSDG
jgi:hypothetical protein